MFGKREALTSLELDGRHRISIGPILRESVHRHAPFFVDATNRPNASSTFFLISARLASRAGRMNGRASILLVFHSSAALYGAFDETWTRNGSTCTVSMLFARTPVSLLGGSPGALGT